MKPLQKNEIFRNLSGFLKSRGIELTEGSYALGLRKSCTILTDAINLSQQSLLRAKDEFERTVDQMRQTIHDKTAPKPPKMAAASPSAGAKPPEMPRKSASATAKAPIRKTAKKAKRTAR